MTPIERLAILAGAVNLSDNANTKAVVAELRAIIEALKQRDEAVRQVAEEMVAGNEYSEGPICPTSNCHGCDGRECKEQRMQTAARLREAIER